MNPHMVHAVDDEESIRRSLAFFLKKNGYAVTGWPSGDLFLDQWPKIADGCILLDLRMPGRDGLEVQRELQARGCSLPIIMLTGHGEIATAVQAMQNGAIDFIEKPFEQDRLLTALGLAFARLENAHEIEAQVAEAKLRIAALTAREQEVLHGLALGLPNKTIGYDLGISARTVEVHRANVMMKLRAKSFSDALRIAFAAGLGTVDPDARSLSGLGSLNGGNGACVSAT